VHWGKERTKKLLACSKETFSSGRRDAKQPKERNDLVKEREKTKKPNLRLVPTERTRFRNEKEKRGGVLKQGSR